MQDYSSSMSSILTLLNYEDCTKPVTVYLARLVVACLLVPPIDVMQTIATKAKSNKPAYPCLYPPPFRDLYKD